MKIIFSKDQHAKLSRSLFKSILTCFVCCFFFFQNEAVFAQECTSRGLAPVTLYEHPCYTGRTAFLYAEDGGDYPALADNRGKYIGDNTTSIVVQKGYKVTLFADPGGAAKYMTAGGVVKPQTKCIELYEGVYNSLYWWDDQISSAKVDTVPDDTPIVIFYDDWWKDGHQNFGPGDYKADKFLKDNIFTTMTIPDGVEVTVFQNSDFTGKSVTLKKNKNNGGIINLKDDYDMNDNISSIQIRKIEYELEKIEIIAERKSPNANPEMVGLEMTTPNNTSLPQEQEIGAGQKFSTSATIHWSNTTTVGLAVTRGIEVGISKGPLSASSSLSITASIANAFEFGKSSTETAEKELTVKCKLNVAPLSIYKVVLMAQIVNTEYDLRYTYKPKDSKSTSEPYVTTATVRIKDAFVANCTYDVVASAKTPTTTTTPTTTPIGNNSLNFDGPNNYVSLGNIGNVSDWTIELWLKPKSLSNYENLFHTADGKGNNGVRLEMSQNFSAGRLYAFVGGTCLTIVPNDKTLSLAWHHLAIVGDKTKGMLIAYLDGVKVGEKALAKDSKDWPTSFPDFVLGRGFSGGNDRNYSGSMDEVRIWNKARPMDEIIAVKGNGGVTGKEANLLACYTFNQGVPNNLNLGEFMLKALKGTNGKLIGFTLNGAFSNWIKS